MYSYIWNTGELTREHSHIGDKYKVEKLIPLFWREHCLECAMPLCYSTCPIYSQRMDGRCIRFAHGITPVKFDGELKVGALIEMKRWAKLQTELPSYPFLISVLRYNLFSKRYQFVERIVRKCCDLVKSYRMSQICASLTERYNTSHFNKVGMSPDGFLSIVKNCNTTSNVLVLEILEDDKSIFKTSFVLQPGWNEYFTPMEKIIMPSPGAQKRQLRAYLNDNETSMLMFEYFDFVKFQEEKEKVPAKKVKCVAWDLDNTLWKGVIGDDGKDGVIPFESSIQLIKQLDERGIIQTIASKNTEDVAWEKIVELGLEDYFLYPAINWGRKSQSLVKIAQELNINIDTFAMIDDSEFERKEISSALPQVRVFDVTDIPSLLERDEFNVPVTEESKKRRQSYISEYKRKNISAGWQGDYDSFLRSCNIVMTIFSPSTSKEKERCLELIMRSNQYNVTGIKYEKDEFLKMLDSEKYDCYSFRVRDDYGDYGIVGFASFVKNESSYELHDFVMSCRVAMKKIERAFFNHIIENLDKNTFKTLKIHSLKTTRNAPLREQLQNMPFTVVSDKDDSVDFVFNTSDSFVDDKVIKIDEKQDV